MPKTAQDRIMRGPFAALLVLLGVLLGSGTAAASGFDSRHPAPRLGPDRRAAAVALAPSAIRNPSDEDPSGAGDGAAVPPSGSGPAAPHLWSRPPAGPFFLDQVAVPKPANAPFRARAPPAA